MQRYQLAVDKAKVRLDLQRRPERGCSSLTWRLIQREQLLTTTSSARQLTPNMNLWLNNEMACPAATDGQVEIVFLMDLNIYFFANKEPRRESP